MSSINDIGNDNGNVKTMKNFVSQIVDAPTNKACLEQSAYNKVKIRITKAAMFEKIDNIMMTIYIFIYLRNNFTENYDSHSWSDHSH